MMSQAQANDRAPIAAIIHAHGAIEDCALLAEFADACRARGVAVRGLVDVITDNGKARACGAELRDLETDARYVIFQDLGPGSTGCRIDPAGVTTASIALRRAVEIGADLVIANRFGKLEASGGGLADDMLAVMVAGIPFLTLVAEPWLEEWRRFTGDAGALLSPRRADLDAWFSQQMSTAPHVVA
jgi:hypothetical protein